MIPYVLFAIGLLLIFLEFYLPGAVLGIIGSLLMFLSIVLFAQQTDSLIALICFILGAGVCVVYLIRFALWRIVHAKPEFSIYSNKDQKDFQASSYDKTLVGKTGIVITDLKPGGYVLINGKQHQAVSLVGYLQKGTEIVAISGDGESLLVKRVS